MPFKPKIDTTGVIKYQFVRGSDGSPPPATPADMDADSLMASPERAALAAGAGVDASTAEQAATRAERAAAQLSKQCHLQSEQPHSSASSRTGSASSGASPRTPPLRAPPHAAGGGPRTTTTPSANPSARFGAGASAGTARSCAPSLSENRKARRPLPAVRARRAFYQYSTPGFSTPPGSIARRWPRRTAARAKPRRSCAWWRGRRRSRRTPDRRSAPRSDARRRKNEKTEPFAFRKVTKIKKRMKIKNRHENFIASNSSEKSVKNLEIIQLVNNSKTPMFRVHK